MSRPANYVAPPLWSVTREWAGERCFVLCSGESLGPQRPLIAKLRGRFIAVKHGVLARPNADILFLSGERNVEIAAELIPKYQGPRIVVRGRGDVELPASVLRVTRSKDHEHLSELRDPAHVGGYDAGTSALHLAHLLGAAEIVMLGYDQAGGHFVQHPLQYPPLDHFRRHMAPLAGLARDATQKGVRIVNCSPTSAVTAFECRPLEEFL